VVHLNKPVSFPILNTICLCAQAQAEETLNTLHFASMALRVKCNPLCILDPQDKLVLNLRGTISKLRSQNKQLSTALQRSRSHSGDGSDRDPDFEHEPVSLPLSAIQQTHKRATRGEKSQHVHFPSQTVSFSLHKFTPC